MNLPLVDPPIAAYQPEATVLSIALRSKTAWKWFHNNFVQLCVFDQHHTREMKFRVFNRFPHDGSECPFVRAQYFLRDYVIKTWNRFSDFVRLTITSGDYVFACLDGYHLPMSDIFQKEHRVHQTLISAIDADSQRVLLSDFFGTHGYERRWVPLREFDCSFPYGTIDTEREKADPWNLLLVVLLRFREVDYDFDTHLLLTLIRDYLRSENTVDSFDKRRYLSDRNVIYGISIYGFLRDYIVRIIDGERVDIRLFHTFYEHKVASMWRTRFLCSELDLNPALYEDSKLVVRESAILRNAVLMAYISGNFGRIRRFESRLDTLYDKEIRILERLYSALK